MRFHNISAVLLLLLATAFNSYGRPSSGTCFTENRGQVTDMNGAPADNVLYTLESSNAKVYFGINTVSYVFRRIAPVGSPLKTIPGNILPVENDSVLVNYHRIDLTFEGSLPGVTVEPLEPAGGYCNVYSPNLPGGACSVRSFRRLRYRNIYPHIDLVFYVSADNNMKYDIIVNPGGSVSDIAMTYKGQEAVELLKGNIIVNCPLGTVTEMKPYTYQHLPGSAVTVKSNPTEVTVASSFNVSNGSIRFDVAGYDKSRALVIDPNVTWSSYYGGIDPDHGYSVTVNGLNEVILVGRTISSNFPVSPGAYQNKITGSYDMYITRMNSDGEIIWTTFYGGTDNEYVNNVCTDKDYNIIVGGWTWSTDFPVSAGAYQTNFAGPENDVVIMKFDSSGMRLWSTFFGGDKTEHLYGLAIDSEDNIIATGWTNSKTFSEAPFATSFNSFQRTNQGVDDVYLLKLNPSGGYVWGTFFGGDSTEEAMSLAVGELDNIYITGSTKSPDFPLAGNVMSPSLQGLRDAFLAQFGSSGNLVYSSYFGSDDNDEGMGICLDPDNNIYITGYTYSKSFPVTKGCIQDSLSGIADAFIMKLNNGKIVQWSTFYGSDEYDYASSIAADRIGNFAITGQTWGNGLPVSPGALSDTLNGITDAFASKFNAADCSLIWGSYYGGENDDIGRYIAADIYDNFYSTGSTSSPDFPAIDPPLQGNYGGNTDAYLMKHCLSEPVTEITPSGALEFCEGNFVSLDGGEGFAAYRWSNGSTDRFVDITESGEFYVTVWDDNYCRGVSKPVRVTVHPLPDIQILGKQMICPGESGVLSSNHDYKSYSWSTGETTKQITVDKENIYELTVIDSFGCTSTTSILVTFYPETYSEVTGPTKVYVSNTQKTYSIKNTNGTDFTWTIVNGTLLSGQNSKKIDVNWDSNADTGFIYLKTENMNTGCISYDTITVVISQLFVPKITTSTGMFHVCEGDTLELIAEEGFNRYEWSTGEKTRSIKVTEEGTYWVKVYEDYILVGLNTTEIIVVQKPAPEVIGDSLLCSAGKEVHYSTAGNPMNIYQWFTKTGNIVSGGNTPDVTLSWDRGGWDTLTVSETLDSLGCEGLSKPFFVYIDTTPPVTISHDRPLTFCSGDSVILRIAGDYAGLQWNDGSSDAWRTVKTSGRYLINALSSHGCPSVDSVDVNVIPSPGKPVIVQVDDTLFTGDYAGYKWKLNGSPVSGAAGKKFVPESEDVYTVEVNNEFGCSDESDAFSFRKITAYAAISIRATDLNDTLFGGSSRPVKALLYLDSSANLNKFHAEQFTAYIRFNKTLLLPEGDFVGVSEDDEERAILINAIRNPATTAGILHEINFTGALGDTVCGKIYLDSVIWKTDSKVWVKTTDGVFCLSDYCITNGHIRLLLVKEDLVFYNLPNPFSDMTEIVFILKEKQQCNVTLSDCYGKQIAVICDGNTEAGEHRKFLNTGQLASGFYYITLRTPTRFSVLKAEIIK